MSSRDIAIVGMACRFAGAPDLPSYWRLVRDGQHAFGPVPADRWNAEAFTSTSRRDKDRTTSPHGAFLDDVRSFPALALGIPPRRVEVMDPQQRLALETSVEAIEDAGLTTGALPHRTGVYVGLTAHEYRTLQSARTVAMLMSTGAFGEIPEDPEALAATVARVVPPRPFTAPGVLGNMTAAAVAQELDLHGPAYTVDAACASAMVALADAVAHLRSGAVDMALAGGAYLQLTPEHYIAFSRIGAMSESGVCRPFDATADGFVQGDGVGMIVLKRREDAERDGDRIYAVLEGIAVNNDGRGDGPMAPVRNGQADVLQQAWTDAGRDPATASHVEAHGTGTSVGDVTEIRSMLDALGAARSLAVGSSKANVGHTMSAAGVAGIIKAALSIHHATLPPLANFDAPKDELPGTDDNVRFPTNAERWDDAERATGVSSFGFGGTNGHAVLTAAPAAPAPPEQDELLLLSAPTLDALADLCARTAVAVRDDPRLTVPAIVRAWATRRRQPARAAIVARTRDELLTALDAIGANTALPAGTLVGFAGEGDPRLAFLFPGQGAQRVGMLRDVAARFPAVADALDQLEQGLDGELDAPLTELMWPDRAPVPVDAATAEARLTATEHCQPAMLAAGLALDALLRQLGVRPDVVTGHSLGEFTAAAVAGVIDPTDAARFVARRGRAMADLPGDHGAMAAVMADRDTVAKLLVDGAVVANVNHPRQIVVSGTAEAVARVVARAEAAEVRAKVLPVSHAFHSPILDAIDSDRILDGVTVGDPQLPVASAISGALYADAADARGVFRRHATSPVVFTDALQTCVDQGADVLLQVGAGGPLASFARGTVAERARWIGTLAPREDGDGGRGLLGTLGQLWLAGVDLDVRPITAQVPVAGALPPSVLTREIYWAIKDGRRSTLKLKEVTAAEAPAASEPVAEAEAPSAGDDVMAGVLAVIAKVSAYPAASLKPDLKLVDDLGFDSLMVGDLATGLAEAFPGVGGIPQELLLEGPTVADIVTFVRTGAAPVVEDDDAPLQRFRPTWVPTPLPDLPGRAVPQTWIVTGMDADVVAHTVERLRDRGITALSATPVGAAKLPADLVVWVGPATRPPGPSDVEPAAWPDQAGDLLPLVQQLALLPTPPDLVALSRADDPWAEGLAGVLRSVAREWPDRLVKHLRAPSILEAAHHVIDEVSSACHTVDVRHGTAREVLGFEPVDLTGDTPPGHDDVVLVSGGTRGLGLQLGLRLASLGATVHLLGRRAPDDADRPLLDAFPNLHVLQGDVLDAASLSPIADLGVTHLVHAAGVLADGALAVADLEAGRLARRVKVEGWLRLLDVCGPTLRRASGIGSWAGRLGNRHQAAYGAANAQLAALAVLAPVPAVVGEYGPFTGSAMASTIPAPVQQAMRADGVDFVGHEAGLEALVGDLCVGRGAVTRGRRLPTTTRRHRVPVHLSVETDPYLADHAIDGTPVLPLAGVADLMAWASGLPAPLEVDDLTLYAGVTVAEPKDLVVHVDGERAKLVGADGRLHDTARVRPLTTPPAVPAPSTASDTADLTLDAFYDGLTFHGPLLQGIRAIHGVDAASVRGTVVAGRPADWTPGTSRTAFTVDPLALDCAMQLAAFVAWTRFRRAGTPVAMGRVSLLTPLRPGATYTAEAWFDPDATGDADRFVATVLLRDDQGEPVLVAEDVVADLKAVETEPASFRAEPETYEPARWPEIQDLQMRLQGVEAMGLQNPYFHVHDGTARNTTSVAGRELVNFSSYNYIGLSGDPRVLEQVRDAVDRYGTSVSASRVASGERPFHLELEAELAEAQGAEAALLFTAGHATNVNAIGHLFGPEDLVLHDAYIHDSALQGIKLSGAKRRSFHHEDADHLEAQLEALRHTARRCLIVVEGVYSMDGDLCELPRFLELKERFGCLLMVDEAHSFGVVGATGRGIGEHHGIDGRRVDLWMGTLSKSLASCGGWLAGSKTLIEYLRYTAPGFVYSAGLTAANGVAALAALRLMIDEPERVRRLQDNAAVFHRACTEHGLDNGPAKGGSGVIPIITGNSMHALVLSERLLVQGINVQPIVYPAVPDDASRLRFFLSSTHTEEQLVETARVVADTLAAVREELPLP